MTFLKTKYLFLKLKKMRTLFTAEKSLQRQPEAPTRCYPGLRERQFDPSNPTAYCTAAQLAGRESESLLGDYPGRPIEDSSRLSSMYIPPSSLRVTGLGAEELLRDAQKYTSLKSKERNEHLRSTMRLETRDLLAPRDLFPQMKLGKFLRQYINGTLHIFSNGYSFEYETNHEDDDDDDTPDKYVIKLPNGEVLRELTELRYHTGEYFVQRSLFLLDDQIFITHGNIGNDEDEHIYVFRVTPKFEFILQSKVEYDRYLINFSKTFNKSQFCILSAKSFRGKTIPIQQIITFQLFNNDTGLVEIREIGSSEVDVNELVEPELIRQVPPLPLQLQPLPLQLQGLQPLGQLQGLQPLGQLQGLQPLGQPLQLQPLPHYQFPQAPAVPQGQLPQLPRGPLPQIPRQVLGTYYNRILSLFFNGNKLVLLLGKEVTYSNPITRTVETHTITIDKDGNLVKQEEPLYISTDGSFSIPITMELKMKLAQL
jgi:hypothetical protein